MTLEPQQAHATTTATGSPEQRRQVRLAALASTVGTTIEWYDFFLYNTAAAPIFPALEDYGTHDIDDDATYESDQHLAGAAR